MADRPSQKALTDFVSESQEVVEALDRGLLRLDDTRHGEEADPEILNAVFRAAHSLKGLSAMVGVERMTRLAHALEDRLDQVRMGRRALDHATLDLLLAAPALFGRIIAEEAARKPPETADAAEELAAGLLAPPSPGADAPPRHAPGPDALELDLDDGVRAVLTDYEEHRLRASMQKGLRVQRVRVGFPLATFDVDLDALKARLRPFGEVLSTLPSSEASDPDTLEFDVLFATAHDVEDVRAAAGPSAAVEAVPVRAEPLPPRVESPKPVPVPDHARDPETSLRSPSQAVRVDIGKLDRLMNLVGELVILKTNLLRIAERLRGGEASTTLGLELHRDARILERKVMELQTGMLDVRMVPLGQIFDKLSRMVRKLSRDLGKQIDFEVKGSEVELDKLLVEELSDPLMHLIRNSLDHAIETPEARVRGGKPPVGRITLSAEQRGNHVVIAVQDDGAGIDEPRVREVAVARGIATPESLAHLSRREVLNLIYLPGFSTAARVTALSGRGVGMDVVKSNIAAMSGMIDFQTDPGKGTRFEITLPVTLAIVRALVVASAGRTYAVPLNTVLELVTLDPTEVRTQEQREVMTLRGTTLPLLRLDRFLGLCAAPATGPSFVVVVGLANERLGIVVDGLVGQQDVVVKPLGRLLAGVRGIAGATDLGNRRTVLVLDVSAILDELARGEPVTEAAR